MNLPGDQLTAFNTAVLDAFDRHSLIRAVRMTMNITLTDIINTNQGMVGIVFDLIEWASRKDLEDSLATNLQKSVPTNLQLKAYCDEYVGVRKSETKPNLSSSAPLPTKRALRQALGHCETMKKPNGRNILVAELAEEGIVITWDDNPKFLARNIIQACTSTTPSKLDTLVEVLADLEDEAATGFLAFKRLALHG